MMRDLSFILTVFCFFMTFARIKQRYDSMENTGKIFGISLGPGDPELITLKALKALNAVDVIFLSGGRNHEGRMKSRALDILRQLEVDETKIVYFRCRCPGIGRKLCVLMTGFAERY